MIENRDIHSYNCDVYIEHEKELYQVDIADGLEISWERKGVAGKCTFSIVQEEKDKVEFQEGDTVKVRISKTWMFLGYIFTINRNSSGVLKVTCYDQLRYLKAKDSLAFYNKSVGEIVTMIANDRGLKKGAIRTSKYKIPTLVKQNATFFDIIMQAIEMTTQATGELFVLYDRFGKLTLCNMRDMNRDVIIDASVTNDFDYESSIDKQTYNVIKLPYQSAADGKIKYREARDEKSIQKWGMLQFVGKETTNGWTSTSEAQTLLEFYNSKTKTLKIRKAMGAVEVVAGAVIIVNMDIGDMKIKRNMVVDAVTHRVEDGLYSMDLELIGGEFVSTRGVQSESADDTSKKSNTGVSVGGGTGAGDWGHGVTVDQIKKALGNSRMAALADKIWSYSNAFKVDPAFITAIIIAENSGNPGRNRPSSKFYYNPLSNGEKPYKSLDEGLWDGIRHLSVNYINKSGKYYSGGSIASIGRIYTPVGASNDVHGTNGSWIPTVSRVYKKITGHDYNPKNSGGGVRSEAEGRNNLTNVNTSSTSSSTYNGELPPQIIEARKHLGKGYGAMSRLGNFTNGLWCADFVSYCTTKTGTLPVPATSNTRGMYDSFKEKGRAKGNAEARKYIPKPGDVIFFYNGSNRGSRHDPKIDHVGLVEKVEGGKVITIEGNSGSRLNVGRHSYNLGASKITGYGIV